MNKTPPDSIHLLFKESDASTISELRIDIQHLPQDLITEILVRLPVKSLLRFKCVSKPWYSLISNPQFISSHFSKSSSSMEADGLNLELLFVTETCMKKCSLYSALHEARPSKHVSAFEFPVQNHRAIVGIINGLVCLNLNGTDLCVWNPALNKFKHFNFYPEAPSCHRRVEYCFSFGYEESNDDYKVVCLQTVLGNDRFDPKVRFYSVHIYSLKADLWRRIDDLRGFHLPNPGVFANGKIYWCGDLIATPNLKIVSLDMLNEKFVELQPPEYEYDAGRCVLKMGVSGGRLFMLCDYCERDKVDLWVLDKRGVEKSWCKLVSFPSVVFGWNNMFSSNNQVLSISSNGDEIVLGDEYGLIVYNWKKMEFRKIKLVVRIRTHWGIAAYVESLVWPDYP